MGIGTGEVVQEDGAEMVMVTVRAVKTTGEGGRMDGIIVGGVDMELSEDVVMSRVGLLLIGDIDGIMGRWLCQGLDRRTEA